MNLIELCRELISIDSSVMHGTRDIAEYISTVSEKLGLSAEIQHENNQGIENANVILSTRDKESEESFALVSRLDTINPGEYASWDRTGANPFNASISGDLIYGLGAAEAKCDFACKLVAFSELSQTRFKKRTPLLLGTFGLSSGIGAIKLIRKKRIKLDAVLVGGPTALRLASKGPGYAKVEISIPFTKAEKNHQEQHDLLEVSVAQSKIFSNQSGGRISQEFLDNPIFKLIDYLKNLPKGITILSVEGGADGASVPESAYLEIDFIDQQEAGVVSKLISIGEGLKRLSADLKSVLDEDCDPAYSTITLGMIRTLPEEIRLSGICRLVPAEGRATYDVWLEKLRQECSAVGASFQIIDYKPPFITHAEEPFIQFLKEVSSEIDYSQKTTAAAGCSDANIFSRMGIASAVFGPGYLDPAQPASHEHVNVKDLEAAKVFYKKVIERYCI